MSTKNLAQVGSSSNSVATADDSANANTIAMRDPNGDLFAQSMRSAKPIFGSQGIYLGVSASKTSGFTADDTVRFYPVDTSSGSVTVNLPTAVGKAGLILTFKKTASANNLVLDGNSTETLDGALTKTSANQFATYTIISDGANWQMLSSTGTWT